LFGAGMDIGVADTLLFSIKKTGQQPGSKALVFILDTFVALICSLIWLKTE
jgi:hypothetical protein